MTIGILTLNEEDKYIVIGAVLSVAAMVLMSIRNVKLKVFNEDENKQKMISVNNVFEMYAFGFVILVPAWLYQNLSDPAHFISFQSTLGKVFTPKLYAQYS